VALAVVNGVGGGSFLDAPSALSIPGPVRTTFLDPEFATFGM